MLPIETWILVTIAVGMCQTVTILYEYVVFGMEGYMDPTWTSMHLLTIIEFLKEGLSKTLVLLVAMGWGVTQRMATYDRYFWAVLVLGILWLSPPLASQIGILDVYWTAYHSWGFYIYRLSLQSVYAIWTLFALQRTIGRLRSAGNETLKLARYTILRFVAIGSIVLGYGSASFMEFLIDERMEKERQVDGWPMFFCVNMDNSIALLQWSVVCTVAVIWRPSPESHQYAYIAPPEGDGAEEIEMTSGQDEIGSTLRQRMTIV